MKKQSYELTTTQAKMLGERIDDLLDDTEDWQMDDEEFEQAIQSWVDILKGLKQDKLVKKIKFGYKHICELS